ncbi:tetratricopeptide repeat protein [soil metagenome]
MNPEEKIEWRLGWLAAAIGFAAFAVVLLNGFVYDDYYFVVDNVWIRDWHNWWPLISDWRTSVRQEDVFTGFWRPLRNLDYMLDYQAAGLNPAWFHFENLVWHGVATLGLYGLFRRLRISAPAAFFAAAFFATHPAQTESVAWVKERDGLLCAAALFWSLYHAAGDRTRSAIVSLLLLIAALLCKETAVIFTPLCAGVLWLRWKQTGSTHRARAATLLGGGVALTIGFLFLRSAIIGITAQQKDPLGGTLLITVWTMCGVFARYLWIIVNPRSMELTYTWIAPPASVELLPVFGVLLLCTLIFVAIKCAKNLPTVSLGIFWFLAALIPFANVVPMMQWMAVRFLYIPIAGIAIVLAMSAERALAGKRIRYRSLAAFYAVGALLIVVLAFSSAMESLHWRSNATLWGRAYEKRPDDPAIMAAYADHLVDLNRFQEALDVLSHFPYEAQPYPEPTAWKAKARALDGLGRGAEALAVAQDAAERFPSRPAAALSLAVMESHYGDPTRAAAAWERLLQLERFHRGAMEQLIVYYDKHEMKDRADELRGRLKRMETLPREQW